MSRPKHLEIPKVLKLIENGKKSGTLTHKEIMDALQDVELTPDQIDDVYDAIEQMGIDLIQEPGVNGEAEADLIKSVKRCV